MGRRLVPALLVVGALALTASLYLPWQRASCKHPTLRSFECALAENVDGWSSGLGAATGVLAVVLVVVGAATLARPAVFGAALGQSALVAGYFGIALAVRAPAVARQEARLLHAHYDVGVGTFVGWVATALLVLGACATPLRSCVQRRPGNVLVLLAAAGLLATLLLPWARFGGTTGAGVALPPGTAAAVLAALVPLVYWRAELPLLGAAALLMAGGAVASVAFPVSKEYGAWIGVGVAAALAAVTLVIGRPRRVSVTLRVLPLFLIAAVALASLFLPWQRQCYPARCLSASAWTFTAGAAVALLVLALLLLTVVPSGIVSRAEPAIAVALLVATLGFGLFDRSELGQSFGYGAYLGFAAFAALVALALADVRPPNRVPRLVECAPAMVACLAYVALVLLPAWQVLSPDVDQELRFGPFSWLTVAGVAAAVHLLARWARRLRGLAARDPLLLVLPAVLLALASLDLIEERDGGLTWGGGGVVALCLGLLVFGGIEASGGLRKVRVPEVLRIDRIS